MPGTRQGHVGDRTQQNGRTDGTSGFKMQKAKKRKADVGKSRKPVVEEQEVVSSA